MDNLNFGTKKNGHSCRMTEGWGGEFLRGPKTVSVMCSPLPIYMWSLPVIETTWDVAVPLLNEDLNRNSGQLSGPFLVEFFGYPVAFHPPKSTGESA